jgi:divalent metal cation (Fe/Co/Zn/Cd) transporter
MSGYARARRRQKEDRGSAPEPVLTTEGRVTLTDGYLAGEILAGLALSAAVGWWWADPVAGLAVVFDGLREGRHAVGEASAARH